LNHLSEYCDYPNSGNITQLPDFQYDSVSRWILAFFWLCGCFLPTPACADPAILSAIRLGALAGDLRPVSRLVTELDEIRPDESLDELSQVLLQQYRDRFLSLNAATALSSESGLAGQAIVAYQNYWRAVLTGTLSPQQADRELQLALGHLLRKHSPGPHRKDGTYSGDVFSQLEQALAQLGLGSSAGFTPPWRDLYIWSGQRTRNFQVELTDGIQQVTVTFIEQPLVQGWQHYASLDLLATSGWATEQGLFCLCWSYDLDSAAFQVSWLKHETRHSVDFREFPGLPEAQLEYRAKLTELAFAGEEVSALLRQFSNSGEADSTSAHAAANYRVSRDIYRQIFQRDLPANLDPWQQLGPDRVAPAARKLLQRDTDRLRLATQLSVP
jgi:hypothetical protein